MIRPVKLKDFQALVEQHQLVQAASNPDRPAYHVRYPSGRRKGVLTDNIVDERGEIGGYVWLAALPDRGAGLLARRPDLVPKGTNDSCVAVKQLGLDDLREVVAACVAYLQA